MDRELQELSKRVGDILREKRMTISTAESCTGGGVAATITAIPGSSEYFKAGVVVYSNEAKTILLNVSEETLQQYGAVSENTVTEMVNGAVKSLKSDVAVAISGIAGPGGGSIEKPVGTVWIATGCKEKILTFKQTGDKGREENINNAIKNTLRLLLELLSYA